MMTHKREVAEFLSTSGLFASPGRHVYLDARNANVGQSAKETIWPGSSLYVYPAAAATLDVQSTSTDDDGDPGGTGARTIRINGLADDFTEISEDVVLDGTTTVVTTKEFFRVNAMTVLTAGSNGSNVGVVTAEADGVTCAQINAGDNRMMTSVFTIPAEASGFLVKETYSAFGNINASVTITPMRRASGGIFIPARSLTISRGVVPVEHVLLEEVPAGSDVEIRAIANGPDVDVTVSLEGLLLFH